MMLDQNLTWTDNGVARAPYETTNHATAQAAEALRPEGIRATTGRGSGQELKPGIDSARLNPAIEPSAISGATYRGISEEALQPEGVRPADGRSGGQEAEQAAVDARSTSRRGVA